MAWAGSAPGAVSPRDWLEGIYDYAVTVMNPEKIFFGLPAYGWNWQIYIQSRLPEIPSGHLRVFTPMTVSPARIPKSVRNSTV